MERDRFESAPELPGWLQAEFPYQRRVYLSGGIRLHFVDQGEGPAVLLQHGNPTWSFLWRKVIAGLLEAGVRVIAPDLVGLGLSDKPRDARVHTVGFHAEQVRALVVALELTGVTIVGQDWGGPIVALMAAREPQRVSGAVFANTALGAPRQPPRATPFHRFANMPLISDLVFKLFNFPVPVMQLAQGDRASIGRMEKRAYRYPLRRLRDRTAPLALARMVPNSLDHPAVEPLAEAEEWARSFTGPVRLVWGTRDPILGRSLAIMQRLFRQAQVTRTEAGHFLQEEVPGDLARAILEVIEEKRG